VEVTSEKEAPAMAMLRAGAWEPIAETDLTDLEQVDLLGRSCRSAGCLID
jgi:hypothetical protein